MASLMSYTNSPTIKVATTGNRTQASPNVANPPKNWINVPIHGIAARPQWTSAH